MLKVKSFTIEEISGNIEVDRAKTLGIECFPQVIGQLEEQIQIHVPDSAPKSMFSVLNLKATSCIPSVNFDQLTSIFQELNILNTSREGNFIKKVYK